MSNRQIQRAVARATGESVSTIRSIGFSILELDGHVAEVANCLCLSCPGCGRDVPLNSDDDALPTWAECARCDIAYQYREDELFLPDADLPIH